MVDFEEGVIAKIDPETGKLIVNIVAQLDFFFESEIELLRKRGGFLSSLKCVESVLRNQGMTEYQYRGYSFRIKDDRLHIDFGDTRPAYKSFLRRLLHIYNKGGGE